MTARLPLLSRNCGLFGHNSSKSSSGCLGDAHPVAWPDTEDLSGVAVRQSDFNEAATAWYRGEALGCAVGAYDGETPAGNSQRRRWHQIFSANVRYQVAEAVLSKNSPVDAGCRFRRPEIGKEPQTVQSRSEIDDRASPGEVGGGRRKDVPALEGRADRS